MIWDGLICPVMVIPLMKLQIWINYHSKVFGLQMLMLPARYVFWHYPVYHHDVPASAIRKGDWKLIKNLVTGKSGLYNLKTDIGETLDLSLLYPEKASELYKLLSDWQNDTGAEFPIENPDFDDKRRYEWGRHPYRRIP